jgi:hypothetical protein
MERPADWPYSVISLRDDTYRLFWWYGAESRFFFFFAACRRVRWTLVAWYSSVINPRNSQSFPISFILLLFMDYLEYSQPYAVYLMY